MVAQILEEYGDLFEGLDLLEGDIHFDVDDYSSRSDAFAKTAVRSS